MLQIDWEQKKLCTLRPLPAGSVPPSEQLRELIVGCPQEFWSELRERLFLLSSTGSANEAATMQADLVAVNRQGDTVLILLPQSDQQSQIGRAIAAVGLIANRTSDDLLEEIGGGASDLEEFLEARPRELNRRQRVIVVSENFNGADLAAAKWLRERSGLEIRCVQATLSADSRGNEFLTLVDVPEPQLAFHTPNRPSQASSAADSAAEAVPPPGSERRKQLRIPRDGPQHLRLGFHGQMLAITRVIDLSDRGLGAEMSGPLPVGSDVTVEGDMHNSESALKLAGRAKVAHCHERGSGVYRVGLSFEEIRCENIL